MTARKSSLSFREGCSVALFNSRGDVLLIRRGAEPFRGQWSLPGGSMRKEESMLECAIRELEEETGLCGRNEKDLKISSNPFEHHRVGVIGGVPWVVHVFAAAAQPDMVAPLCADDADDACFVKLQDISTMECTPGLQAILNSLVQRAKGGAIDVLHGAPWLKHILSET